MIPHILHFVWVGPRPFPRDWFRGWRALHTSWQMRVWHEGDLRALPLHNRPVLDWYLARRNWPGAANVARVEVLLRFGGVYTDIDSEPLRTFDDAPFMAAGFFAGYTLPLETHPGRIGNGTMGAIAQHPVLAEYARNIRRQRLLEPAWDTTGGTLLTRVLAHHRDDPGVVILPAGTFYAEGRRGVRADDGSVAYVRHFWSSSPGPIRAYPR